MDFFFVTVVIGLIIIIVVMFIIVFKFIASIKGDRARKLLDAGDYKVLIEALQKDLSKNDRNYRAHFYIAEAYFRSGRAQDAIRHYRKLILIGKYDDEVDELKIREHLADGYLSLGQLTEAQKEFLLILDTKPNDYIYSYRVAEIFYERNYRDNAKVYFSNVLKLNPNHKESIFRIGQIDYSAKNMSGCIANMDRCLKVDRNYLAANYYIGLVHADAMNYIKAIEEFSKSVKVKEYRLMSFYHMGRCYFMLMDLERATVELERGLFYVDDNERVALSLRYLLASVYEKRRDLPMAVAQWEAISLVDNAYQDVQSKLVEYQDIRLDDSIKDFMVASDVVFDSMCQDIVKALDLEVIEYTSTKGLVGTVLAAENENKWTSQRVKKIVVRIYRLNEEITKDDIRTLVEEMKKLGAYRCILITSSNISRFAYEYADTRPVYIYDKQKLSQLIKKAYAK